MNQAEQPANAADPSRGAKRGAKPKACDTCRPLKTKCAPREGTCGRCIRMGIDCVRSHVQLQQASESAASESSSQQSAEGDDHSADSVGAETVPEQSQEATLIADSTGPETRSNHQDQMAIFPSSSDRGSTPPLSDEDMDPSSDVDDSEADSEQSHVEAPWTLNSSYLIRDPIPLATIADEVLDFFTRSSSADWSGRTTVVRVTRLEASFHLLISSEAIEFHKGYLAADDDDIVATLFGRQFSDPLQELGYIMRRRELGYKRRSDIIIDNFARSFKSIYDQDVRPSLFSLLFSCKQQPVVPDQVWICIKSDGNIPVGTVFETLPQQGQESQLEQVELDEVTGPDLQLIRKKLWEIYGSSI